MPLGLIQSLTEMSPRYISWDKGGRCHCYEICEM